MKYYLVWLTSELSEEQQRLLGLFNPGVLVAHWNGYECVAMSEVGVRKLEKIGVVHLKEEVEEKIYRPYVNAKRWKAHHDH